jgi:hypothetical protein
VLDAAVFDPGLAVSRCVNCGETVIDGSALCTHHVTGHGDDWAVGNRIMCDFVHRGIVLSRPSAPVGQPIDFLIEEFQA